MTWHGYAGIENLAMNASQKAQLVAALRALGNQPHLISQFRARLDGEAAIFEAEFGDNDLTVPSVKQYLGNVFGVDPALIAHVAQNTQYGPLLRLSYLGTEYLRMVTFAGTGATWEQSRQAAVAYLIANAAAWDGPPDPFAATQTVVYSTRAANLLHNFLNGLPGRS